MRIGLIALLHESNTFSSQPTTLESFQQDVLLSGDSIRNRFAGTHHEMGGFLSGLDAEGATAIPLLAARALPSGIITADAFDALVDRLLDAVRRNGQLDGLLVAPHGATVSTRERDADGFWLASLRSMVGPDLPIIGTLDAHANLSHRMVTSCNALIAYRTNPHLDQRARGIEASRLMVRTLRDEVDPVMAAVYPPMAIRIDRQCTEESPLTSLYRAADLQREADGVLSNSILLGFPYADVEEMGSAAIVVANGNRNLAERLAGDLGTMMWDMRRDLHGPLTSVSQAVRACETTRDRVCLLDMGDNVGGGSAADGTELLEAIYQAGIGPAFGVLYDPESVARCHEAGPGKRLRLSAGGRTDELHGAPMDLEVTVRSLHDGRFREAEPRHGGFTDFDQGQTVVCDASRGLTLMLTSRRMVPFSLQQLVSCDVDPRRYRILVAKGVNAPIAAYREVCDRFIRVNTTGSTCADMTRLAYHCRRSPLFPFEPEAAWT